MILLPIEIRIDPSLRSQFSPVPPRIAREITARPDTRRLYGRAKLYVYLLTLFAMIFLVGANAEGLEGPDSNMGPFPCPPAALCVQPRPSIVCPSNAVCANPPLPKFACPPSSSCLPYSTGKQGTIYRLVGRSVTPPLRAPGNQ